jgi:8-oxo-dGTP pyrophosphatase MutT (NUDIX family)
MKLIINENNLELSDIDEFSSKVRAIIINKNNELLVCKYGETYLLPGGKIDDGEEQISALIRELHEETGTKYLESDFSFFMELNYYQKDYPKRDSDSIVNRLLNTYYYKCEYREINLDKQILSDKEIKSNFKLEFINLKEIENIIENNINDNPRNIFFQNELLNVIKYIK